MEKHVKTLGTLYIVFSIMQVMFAFYIFIFNPNMLPEFFDSVIRFNSLKVVLVILYIPFIIVPGIVCGAGLKKYKTWARIILLILGCFYLLYFPVGTVVGIYTIWVLMNGSTKRLFSRKTDLTESSEKDIISDLSMPEGDDKIEKKARRNILILSTVHIIFNGLCILIASYHLISAYRNGSSSENLVVKNTIMIGKFAYSDIMLFLIALLGLLGAIELLKWKRWARIVVLIVGFFQLANIPVGTILGIYTLWILLKKDTRQLFADGLSASDSFSDNLVVRK